MPRIELHHVDRKCRATTDHTFPVRWPKFEPPGATDILASCFIEGADAAEIVRLLERSLSPEIDLTLCGHYPDYGVRCFEDDRMVLETTICLSCGNWIRPADGERCYMAPGALQLVRAAFSRFLRLQ